MATVTTTVDPREAAHFGAMAAEWWDPRGSSAMLHRLNPVRLGYIREQWDAHVHGDARGLKPLAGARVLDMGCGAGLLSEPLARLGGVVTGVDAAFEGVAVARAHAAGQGLTIDYRVGDADAVAGETFDLVVSLEVIEHAADPAAFVARLAHLLAPGGLMILSTPNRTPLSRLLVVELAERFGGIPRGTHDWSRFVAPGELGDMVRAAGLEVIDTRGIMFDPARGFRLGSNLDLDYLITARRA
nr:bifunctional 2-polyprenyl-6-hydroxyphenol methylase/3-demethylubiquinol 3-O-methyltransferase UbiG [Sphingomonas jatrophae]